MSKNLFTRQKGRLFEPKFTRQNKPSSNFLREQLNVSDNQEFLKNTNIESSSSFRYGNNTGIVSSQQLRVDYSRFENHIFFHSAVASVNEAFDKIVNFYPYEKNRKGLEQYEDELTGFEKYILDQFPKNVGYLNFSGSLVGEPLSNGSQINVQDMSGGTLLEISDKTSGAPVLDPNCSPFCLEMFLKIPDQANDNQVILQKYSSLSNNFTLALSESASTSACEIRFSISSGSNYLMASGSIEKGSFNHVSALYDPHSGGTLELMINQSVHTSSNNVVFQRLNYNASDLTIGTGETHRSNGEIFTNKQSFSGSIDDLRFFHKVFPKEEIQERRIKSYYPQEGDNLKLYFRFNEPYGDYSGNDLVFDASGNSLHSRIENFDIDLRSTGSDVPVLSENLYRNPVLFPTYDGIIDLNTNLLTTASLYDEYNPNLITKLVPQHYFQEATNYRDYSQELEQLERNFHTFSQNNPGQNKSDIPAVQLLMKLLLSYAKFFDELKLFIDAVTSYANTDYEDYDTTPDPFLIRKAKRHNIKLPQLFSNANIEQELEGVNLSSDGGLSVLSLNQIQNLIWRRILSEAPKVNKSKGTINSIKGMFRSTGIEPDNIMNFREYGGSKEKSLEASREISRDVYRFLDFSRIYDYQVTSLDDNGYPIDSGFGRIKGGYLSGSRTEVGLPLAAGTFVNKTLDNPNGESDNPNDGLYTSGSFTYEALYKWDYGYKNQPESLVRMHVTGTLAPSSKEACLVNLVATDEDITLYMRDNTEDLKSITIGDVNVFDGDIWNVSFGKKDAHDMSTSSTGSFFLRVGKQFSGDIIDQRENTLLVPEPAASVFKNISEYNTSGSFFVIGEQDFQETGKGSFLNDNTLTEQNAFETHFYGTVSNIRFYSKNITDQEFLNHVKNYDSFGVQDPRVNYGFSTLTTGSFERLIAYTDGKQNTNTTDSLGSIRLFDLSQNNLHFEGSNFDPESTILLNKRVNFEVLSDKFDLNQTKEKIRIRSFQNANNINQSYFSTTAPVDKVLPSHQSTDDNRFSIDMSVMSGLNKNMMKIFSDLSSFEDSLGHPNVIFGDRYQDLKYLREIYFNNVLSDLDLEKYRSLFKWIDNSFSDIVYSMLPRTTSFLGINFIYESHVLERNRYRYLYDEIYMMANQRENQRSDIYMSLFEGRAKRH